MGLGELTPSMGLVLLHQIGKWRHFRGTLPLIITLNIPFHFRSVLDLQKSCGDSIENSYVLYTPSFPS